jgi:hypothetical protein
LARVAAIFIGRLRYGVLNPEYQDRYIISATDLRSATTVRTAIKRVLAIPREGSPFWL